MRIWRTHWTRGPAAAEGTVLVSVTDFTGRARDLPAIYRAGMDLRRAWPDMEGAVGLWLWASPGRRRTGSVSVWRGEADLLRFVGWKPHVAIMRRFRDRGALVSHTWETDAFAPPTTWARAEELLAGTRRPPLTATSGGRSG
ncbi:hypothetical protein [Actinomadura litoris]|uniref:hypothetical protein n=1 Tax=Actinomadura litoris TaxID=2678616 RepID=UPI001FA7C1F9|nr:hypothetical protein [Actinomadura litoris]